jgi:hypothetical protein
VVIDGEEVAEEGRATLGEAPRSSSPVRGERSTMINGDQCGWRRWFGEQHFPALLAGGSGQNPVLVEQATTANLSPGLDIDEGDWRWLVMVSRDGGGGRAEQR